MNTLADSFLGKISSTVLDKFFGLYRENKPFEFSHQSTTNIGPELKLTSSTEPFYHVVFENLLSKDTLAEIEEGLLKIPLSYKSNDLYKFKQSNDLNSFCRLETIRKIKNEIVHPLKHFCRRITGFSLNDKVDLFYSKYEYSDYLLCHDDRLENRAIAFIYYMTPEDWNQDDGGSLVLLNSKDNEATTAEKKYVPVRNSLVFFIVSEKSFHQVQEILSLHKSRNSLTGWFHVDAYEKFDTTQPEAMPKLRRHFEPIAPNADPNSQKLFLELVNESHQYPSEESAQQVKEYFAQESQGSLPLFLKPEIYKRLFLELKESNNVMRKCIHKSTEKYFFLEDPENYEELKYTQKVFNLFTSKYFMEYLEKITGLNPFQFEKPKSELIDHTFDDNNDSSDDFIPSKIFKDDEKSTVTNSINQDKLATKSSKNKQKISHYDSDITKSSLESTPDHINLEFGSDHETSANQIKKTTTPIDRHSVESLTASLTCQLQLWKHKCFSALNDSDFKNSSFLDVTFMVMENQEWHDDCGGFLSYVSKDEESEILRVSPSFNCLNIVFRNANTQKFVKYVNTRSKDQYSPEKYFLFNLEIKISENSDLETTLSSIYSSDFDMIDLVEGLAQNGSSGAGNFSSYSDDADTSRDDGSEDNGYESMD